VVFIPIPETSTRLAALEAGDVDLVTDVPPTYASQPGEGVEVATIPGTRAFYLGLNVNVEPFTDVRVRQAMNYAVDVPAIIEFVLHGLARPIDNPLLPEAFGYSSTPVYHYDPDMAVSLLTEAGYADGFEMEIDTDPTLKEIAEALVGQLSEVGITASVNVMERAAFLEKYEPGGSQAFLTSWGNSEADADGILSKQFYSKRYGCDLVAFSYPAPESGFGDADKGCYYTGYGNAEVDAAVEEGARNVDPAARQAAYASALDIIVEEAPWVFLYNPSEIYAYTGVEGWTPRSDALINLANASVTE
jgi:peptide/nickel transport system substrate-binding protein